MKKTITLLLSLLSIITGLAQEFTIRETISNKTAYNGDTLDLGEFQFGEFNDALPVDLQIMGISLPDNGYTILSSYKKNIDDPEIWCQAFDSKGDTLGYTPADSLLNGYTFFETAVAAFINCAGIYENDIFHTISIYSLDEYGIRPKDLLFQATVKYHLIPNENWCVHALSPTPSLYGNIDLGDLCIGQTYKRTIRFTDNGVDEGCLSRMTSISFQHDDLITVTPDTITPSHYNSTLPESFDVTIEFTIDDEADFDALRRNFVVWDDSEQASYVPYEGHFVFNQVDSLPDPEVQHSNTFRRIATLDQLTTGRYVIADNTCQNIMTNNDDKNWLVSKTEDISGGVYRTDSASYIFDIEVDADGFVTITNGNESLTYPGGKNNAKFEVPADTADTMQYKLIPSLDADSDFVFKYLPDTNRILQYNQSSPRFAFYSVNQKNLSLFKEQVAAVDSLKLSGSIELTHDSIYIYDGSSKYPQWRFTDAANDTLLPFDYEVRYINNIYPTNEAVIEVSGRNHIKGTLLCTFRIDKAPWSEEYIKYTLPADEIEYDGKAHNVSWWDYDRSGLGIHTLTYSRIVDTIATATASTIEPGKYLVYAEVSEGEYYYGCEKHLIDTFEIFAFDTAEWQSLKILYDDLAPIRQSNFWEFDNGITTITRFAGLTVKRGHIAGIKFDSGYLYGGKMPLSFFLFPHLQNLELRGNNLNGNIGKMLTDSMASGRYHTDSLKTLKLYGNNLSGDIAELTGHFPNLTYIDVQENHFSEITAPLSEKIIHFLSWPQYPDSVYEITTEAIAESRVPDIVPSIYLYNHYSRDFEVDYSYSIDLSTPDDAQYPWSVWLDGYADKGMTFGLCMNPPCPQFVYRGENGDTLNAGFCIDYGTVQEYRARLIFDRGDANFDAAIDVLDLQSIVNYIVIPEVTAPFNFTASDLKKDSTVNVQDVVKMVDMIVDTLPAAMQQDIIPLSKTRNMTAAPMSDMAYTDGESLILSSAEDVAAFDIYVSGATIPQRLPELDKRGFSYRVVNSDGGARLVAWSLSGATLAAGTVALTPLDGGTVESAVLANSQAKAITQPAPGIPTGTDDACLTDWQIAVKGSLLTIIVPTGADCCSWAVYAIDGRRLASGVEHDTNITVDLGSLSPGCYILTTAATDSPIVTHKINITK